MAQKSQATYRGKLNHQSEFSRIYASWANNHRGWSKMKRYNKRVAKKRLRATVRKEICNA